VVVLFITGDQVPVIPFNDVVGNAAKAAPAHIGVIAAKVGVTIGFTTITFVIEVAHCPLLGVKV
jgi:hypothetical protein